MLSGARQGKISGLRRLLANAMARDLKVFVVPGLDIARVYGLDIEAAGMQVVASPRHASVLLVLGDISLEMRDAASIVYAQMLRPKAVFTVGTDTGALAPLPEVDVSVELSQQDLMDGVAAMRAAFKTGSFQLEISDYDAPALHVRMKYVCPMHPEVVSDNPGACPKCGMTLAPREVQASTEKAHTGHGETHKNIEKSHNPTHDQGDQKHMTQVHSNHQKTSIEYTCPMHPEVVKNEPGDCPKCGMHLEPRDKPATEHREHHHMSQEKTAVEYTCPMHPEVVQNEPGDCPKCGMHLEPRDKPAAEHHEHHHMSQKESAVEYTCPMHPEVVQNEPGKCPKCGMFLEPKKEQHTSAHEQGSSQSDDHSGMDHSQMNHDDSGFMSMVDVTKDLPRSSDDLQMEWIDTAFGPFFPGLPSGLQLTFTLDGDTVAGSSAHAVNEKIALLEHSPMHAGCFVKHFLSLDPLTPVSSQGLICQAMENVANISIDSATAKARIGALERERVASHLNWLVLFAQQTGFSWLARSAGLLQLKFQSADIKQIVALKPDVKKIIQRLKKTPLLKARTSGIAHLADSDVLCGIVARAAGIKKDVRSDDAHYISLGFTAIHRNEGDAWARLQLRLDEILQSLSLIEAAGVIELPTLIDLDELSGVGKSQIETPRGKASLELSMDKGFITSVQLQTPSAHHLTLIDNLIEQQELGDALIAVGSLDLSPWEIRQ